jgi:ketosteroid isomerase-like protein
MKKFALSALVVVLLLVMLFPIAQHMRASSSDDAAIRALVQLMIVAFNAKDIDKIMSLYVTGNDLVAFDVVPPRQYVGSDAYRKDWQEFLDLYSGTPTMEITDLTVGSSGDLGYSHQIVRLTGALKKGGNMDLTLRVSDVYRKHSGKWHILHEHASVPVDVETGKADLQSKP